MNFIILLCLALSGFSFAVKLGNVHLKFEQRSKQLINRIFYLDLVDILPELSKEAADMKHDDYKVARCIRKIAVKSMFLKQTDFFSEINPTWTIKFGIYKDVTLDFFYVA